MEGELIKISARNAQIMTRILVLVSEEKKIFLYHPLLLYIFILIMFAVYI